METNFFSKINELNITGTIHLVISRTENQMGVAIHVASKQFAETEGKLPRLAITGTFESLDESFFSDIKEPLKARQKALFGIKEQQKAIKQLEEEYVAEERKKKTLLEKTRAINAGHGTSTSAKSKEDIEAEKAKQKRISDYKSLLAEVEKLEAAKSFRQAHHKLKSADYPEFAEEIAAKGEALRLKYDNQLDLL